MNLICGPIKMILSKYFFNESDFCKNTPYLFNPISKMFCNFSLKIEYGKSQTRFFKRFGPGN